MSVCTAVITAVCANKYTIERAQCAAYDATNHSTYISAYRCAIDIATYSDFPLLLDGLLRKIRGKLHN